MFLKSKIHATNILNHATNNGRTWSQLLFLERFLMVETMIGTKTIIHNIQLIGYDKYIIENVGFNA